jgi:hypothetical protein
LKKALTIDYDTMYIFREYTILSAMRDILGIKNYKYKSSPDALLVEDSHYKIILLKNHEIVYDNDFEHHYTYIENGSIVEGKGIFDGNTITDYALLYTSPIFCVEKKLNDNGKEFYILREIKTQEEDIEKK